MDDVFFSFTPFDFNEVQGGYGPLEDDYEKEEDAVLLKGKQQVHDQEANHLSNFESSFYPDHKKSNRLGGELSDLLEDLPQDQQLQDQQQKPKSNYSDILHDFDALQPPQPILQQEVPQLTNTSPSTRTASDDMAEAIKQTRYPSSLGLLNNYKHGFKKLRGDKFSINIRNKTCVGGRKKLSSTEEIMRVAGARYIQFFNHYRDDYSYMPLHPYGYALSGLSEEEIKDVELAHFLLAAAEKVSYRRYVCASRLLLRCDWIASSRSNPVQRVVFYFAQALRERIEKQTGRSISRNLAEQENINTEMGHLLSTNVLFLKCYQAIPFPQVLQFAGIQTILENIGSETKVHVIDLEIRSGVQWTVLMQALAGREECSTELLKITAVGIKACKHKTEETGKRLASVAESLNLPFLFKTAFVSDMNDIREELFEIDDDEAVIVYSSKALRTMISRPRCLENLMRVMRNLYPTMMVVVEVEANHNSPSFVNRFIEALFFYSAFFDCLETCVKQVDCRNAVEGVCGMAITEIVAMEGSERVTRNVKMDVWRAFFARFKMVETKLSDAALYQASLVAKQFGNGSSCTLDRNGKCLIAGWKGTPIMSLSVWKFR